jgi:ETC complex I subunit conserved region
VNANAHVELVGRYSQVLSSLQKLPETSGYRSSMEALYNTRLATAKKAETVEQIEEVENGILAENLIEQADSELKLINLMTEWKAWEPCDKPAAAGQWDYFK